MVYLIFGFVCSALVSIVLKLGERYQYERYGMLCINYATCVLLFLLSQIGKPFPGWNRDAGFCLLLSVINCFLYVGCMVVNQLNVKRNGAILQSTFARLGVMVPTLISILFFGERPSALQIAGILLVLIAFSVMNIRKEGNADTMKPSLSLLLLSLLLGGSSDSMSKIFEQYGLQSLDDWFIGLTFLFSFIICTAIMLFRKERVGRKEMAFGFALGIPNYISSLLLLKALSFIAAYIAYPMYSVGAILVVISVSTIFFREKISKWCSLSVLLLVIAILLLNI